MYNFRSPCLLASGGSWLDVSPAHVQGSSHGHVPTAIVLGVGPLRLSEGKSLALPPVGRAPRVGECTLRGCSRLWIRCGRDFRGFAQLSVLHARSYIRE